MKYIFSLLSVFAIGVLPAAAQENMTPDMPDILSLQQRAELQDTWTLARLETVVPALMRREGVDMWVLVAREYNEDPVVMTMLPATHMAARRTTILVFHDPGGGAPVERLTVSRYAIGTFFESVWDPESQPDQWTRFAEIVRQRQPAHIAINVSPDFPLADGLSSALHAQVLDAIPEFSDRMISGEALAIGWLETRSDSEMAAYPEIVRIAHAIIAEGFSGSVIMPGVTTADDLVWWFRERIADLKLDTWFHPSINIQRSGRGAFEIESMAVSPDAPIERGDLLHIDFGITYMGLNTDTQHHAYVLREGESEAPAGLRAGLAAANRLQDILISQFQAGRTGNEVLAAARETALAEGLTPSIYTHPIGFHGHGAGATIGMWDNQGPTPVRGDWPVNPQTAWSIELNVEHAVPEWDGQTVRFMLEEDAFFDGESVEFLDGRQSEFHLVGQN